MNAFDQLMNGHWQVSVDEVQHGIAPDTQRFIALALVAWMAWGLVKSW